MKRNPFINFQHKDNANENQSAQRKGERKNPTKRNKEVNNNFFFSQVLAYTYLFIYFPNLTSPISISYHGKPSGYSEQS